MDTRMGRIVNLFGGNDDSSNTQETPGTSMDDFITALTDPTSKHNERAQAAIDVAEFTPDSSDAPTPFPNIKKKGR